MSDEYRIQELLERDVYVGDTRVGVITGERFHPRDELVQSMRIKVEGEVAEQYMKNQRSSLRYRKNWCTVSCQTAV